MTFEDKQLVEEAQNDSKKFAALYDKYFDNIYRYVFRRINNKEVAQDLISQTFCDAFASLKNYQYQGYPFSSWLYKIAYHNILKWYADNKKHQFVELEKISSLADGSESQTDALVRKENQDELKLLLSKLDTDEQEIIKLKYFEEISNIEIADIIGLNPNNVGVKIYRALGKLKQYLTY